jgi:hypothetical protein
MTTNEQRATSLLQHYLRMAVTASGQRWDSDNSAEVAEIIDNIIDACTPSTPSTPAQPDALTRIAVALEDIAHTLNEISDRGSGIDFSTKLYGR